MVSSDHMPVVTGDDLLGHIPGEDLLAIHYTGDLHHL
jgi:hypothetical protein